jgi:hypothetical protein
MSVRVLILVCDDKKTQTDIHNILCNQPESYVILINPPLNVYVTPQHTYELRKNVNTKHLFWYVQGIIDTIANSKLPTLLSNVLTIPNFYSHIEVIGLEDDMSTTVVDQEQEDDDSSSVSSSSSSSVSSSFVDTDTSVYAKSENSLF